MSKRGKKIRKKTIKKQQRARKAEKAVAKQALKALR
jgi:hypothetical protein